MKKSRIASFFLIFLIAAITVDLMIYPAALAIEEPDIGAGSAVIAEMGTDHVFYAKNENARVYPASLTKIMTVLIAAEAIENGSAAAGDLVTASENISYDLTSDGSTANIQPGETLTLQNLMYCALVASANEACNIIAEYISGSISAFIERMNEKALEIGCTGTRFTNTHGLPDDGHYTTAWDFYLITKEAMSNELFAEICGTKEYEVPATDVSPSRSLTNTNALLGDNQAYQGYYYEYAHGVKTGYHSAAGYCLSSYAVNEAMQIICIVMNAQETQNADGSVNIGSFSDTIALCEWAFNNFSYKEIMKSTEVIATIPVSMGSDTDSVSVRPESSFSALLPNDIDPLTDFERDIVLYNERDNTKLVAPISAGDLLGEISIVKDGETFASVPLVATSSVELSKFVYIRDEIGKVLSGTGVRIIIFILAALFILYIVYIARYRIRRMRHLRTVRGAYEERAMRQADGTADEFGTWEETGSPDQAWQHRRPRVDNFDEGDYYDNEPEDEFYPAYYGSENGGDERQRDHFD